MFVFQYQRFSKNRGEVENQELEDKLNQIRVELSREKCARQLAENFSQQCTLETSTHIMETAFQPPMTLTPAPEQIQMSAKSQASSKSQTGRASSSKANMVPTGKQLRSSPQPSPTAAQTIKPPDMERSYETVKHIKWDSEEEYECFCFLKKVFEQKGQAVPRKLATHEFELMLREIPDCLSRRRHRNEYKIRKRMNDFILDSSDRRADLERVYAERNQQ